MTRKIIFICLLSGLMIFQVSASPKAESGRTTRSGNPGPVVSGPITGGEHGWPFAAYFGDIKSAGYIEEEYFLEGEAVRYSPEGELSSDGMWTLTPGNTSPYKTRILVRRPLNAAEFNGTVILEWANVSGGYEILMADSPGIYENGFAYVSVSAQPLGLVGFPSNPRGLINWDRTRYGTLSVPDEGVSYDIFTQAAKAVGPQRASFINGPDPMAGLTVKRLFGVGGSQSGSRIAAYINGIQPITRTFDALLPFVNAGTASDFEDPIAHPDRAAGQRTQTRTVWAKYREDSGAKVFTLNTESETIFYSRNRQPDTDNFRSWEIAGSSHGPYRQMQFIGQKTDRDGMTNSIGNYSAVRPSEVAYLYTIDAIYVHIQRWLDDGTPPPSFPVLQIAADGRDYARDSSGNATGGVRLPELEVPVARYGSRPGMLSLAGYTIPYSEARLKELYPTHEDYVNKVTAAANAARDAGVILQSRVDEYIRAAEATPIPEYIEPSVPARARQ
jgi:hypothetical protein